MSIGGQGQAQGWSVLGLRHSRFTLGWLGFIVLSGTVVIRSRRLRTRCRHRRRAREAAACDPTDRSHLVHSGLRVLLRRRSRRRARSRAHPLLHRRCSDPWLRCAGCWPRRDRAARGGRPHGGRGVSPMRQVRCGLRHANLSVALAIRGARTRDWTRGRVSLSRWPRARRRFGRRVERGRHGRPGHHGERGRGGRKVPGGRLPIVIIVPEREGQESSGHERGPRHDGPVDDSAHQGT